MSTYYEILGVEPNATASEIKKGYFSMVRKYPPERFPEKFMEIRSAYETLSNEKTKREYDQIISISPIVRQNFEFARQLLEHGEHKKAIKILEEINSDSPDISMIRSTLGEAYIANNNLGKAINIFESLVRDYPDNPSFSGHLAHAYLERGWQRKAIDAFERAIELDEDNVSLWTGLSGAYIKNKDTGKAREVLHEALKRHKDENQDIAIGIYFSLLMIDIQEACLEGLKTNLDKLTMLAINQEDIRENVGFILFNIARNMVEYQVMVPAKEILDRAEKLIPDNVELKSLKADVNKFFELEKEFQKLDEDDSYDGSFIAFITSKIFPKESLRDGIFSGEIVSCSAEKQFLEKINFHKRYIDMLKEEYPKIYEHLKDYFVKALDVKQRKKLLKECDKYLESHSSILERAFSMFNDKNIFDFEEDDEDEDEFYFERQEPFVREEPKVGRNDPCPCGRGKKYKKCCGNCCVIQWVLDI